MGLCISCIHKVQVYQVNNKHRRVHFSNGYIISEDFSKVRRIEEFILNSIQIKDYWATIKRLGKK